MKVIPFRLYKNWNDHELMMEIEIMSHRYNQNLADEKQYSDHLNSLFHEAKLRKLTLQEREIWEKVLFFKEN